MNELNTNEMEAMETEETAVVETENSAVVETSKKTLSKKEKTCVAAGVAVGAGLTVMTLKLIPKIKAYRETRKKLKAALADAATDAPIEGEFEDSTEK